jgi:hypothetical protein
MTAEPHRPPDLLAGPTADYWVRRTNVSLLWSLLFCPLMVVGSILAEPTREIVVLGALTGLLFFAFRGMRAGVSGIRAELRERQAGYTTLRNKYRRLWQLDPATGAVIRRPGEVE